MGGGGHVTPRGERLRPRLLGAERDVSSARARRETVGGRGARAGPGLSAARPGLRAGEPRDPGERPPHRSPRRSPRRRSVRLHKAAAPVSRFLVLPPALGARPEVSKLPPRVVQEVPGHKAKCSAGERRAASFSLTGRQHQSELL